MMKISEDGDNSDSDFISYYKVSRNGLLFGSFLRLRESSESFLSIDDLDKEFIDINDVVRESSENSAGTIKDSAFFAFKENYLVMTNAHNNKKAFLTYLRWLARESGTTADFDFNPVHNKAKEIPIKEIKSIQLADSYISSKLQSQSFNLKHSIIKSIMSDVNTSAEFDWDKIVSATLLVKMKKSELRKQEALDAALRLTDSDDVIIIGRNGKRLKGSDYIIRAERLIESGKNGMFNIPQIEGVMYEIINTVKAGEVVS